MKNDDFINKNIALVKNIASKYSNSRIPFEDLIQEGLIGLIEAKKKYNPQKNIKFSTYAYFWIHKKIRKFIKNEKKMELTEFDDNVIKNICEKEPYKNTEIKFPNNLDKIEKDILKHFFEKKMPLDKIAILFDLRRERVRQIKQKALRKIRINTKLT